MRLRGLLCRLAAADPEHLETISWSGTPHDLADVRAAGVYLVSSSTLDAIRRRFRDIFMAFRPMARVPWIRDDVVRGAWMRRNACVGNNS